MIAVSIRTAAYHAVEELRREPFERTAQSLAAQLAVGDSTVGAALDWLLSLNAPIERMMSRRDRRVRRWLLIDREYRIPYVQLPAQCRLWELERAIAPGAGTNLLECTFRLQRDNRTMREKLMRKNA